MKKIAVIGLGYVGLPLALLAEEKGFDVVGIDLSQKKLSMLRKKQSPIDDVQASNRLIKSKIKFSDDFSFLNDRDIAIICVPTPVHKDKMPDLSIVKNASISAAKILKDGSLLIIESTINPGVCDEIIIPAIEAETNHKAGKSLHIAHCPERINPGDPKWHVGNINRVLGANSDNALKIAYDFYTSLVDAQIKKMGNLKEAEAVKIVENSFRDINIAFVNELAMSFAKLGINVNNVIEGAATKPFAFMAHYPGIGVGGHCIPVDPYYLIEYARGNGFDHHFLKLARSINENMPVYAVDTIEQKLIELGKGNLRGKEVTVLGLAYKPNVADDRESPAYTVIEALEERGSIVKTYDPHILEKSSSKSLEDATKNAEVIILVTSHNQYMNLETKDLNKLLVFYDGRGVFSDKKEALEKSGANYINVGLS
jgi:UDP-N-acetyl-D-glucosamine dehydrogenase